MKKSLNSTELLEFQPNRYPFLMIDYVTKFSPGKFAEGYKNFTNNEWFFPIHFKGNPNVPGALQLEAMAQMLTVAITTLPGLKGKVTHALEHNVKFKKEDIITVFLALQKQNFILSNSLMNLVESWPKEPAAMFGILI